MPRRTNLNRKRAPRRRNPPARKSNPSKQLVARSAAQLEACEEMYLRALTNPFDPIIRGKVCYPSFPAKSSLKYSATALINVSIGTAGVGWICFDPTVASTVDAIFYTDATYAGTTSSSITTTPGSGVVAAKFVTPVGVSSFNEGNMGNQFRIIVAGAKFRYTGTELNRGGSVFTFNSPQQVSLNGFALGNATIPAIAREHRVVDSYQCVVVPPSHEEDVEWKDADQTFPWSDGGGTTVSPISAMAFFGTPGNTFVVKFIIHFEVAGPGFNNHGTLSHIGRQQVVQSITTAASTSAYGVPSESSYGEQFAKVLKRMSHNPVIQTAGNMAMQLGYAYISRRLGLPGFSAPTNVGLLEGSSGRIAMDVD